MNLSTFNDLKNECISQNKTIWELTQLEQAQTSDITIEEVRKTVLNHIEVMRETIKTGMASNEKSISNWCGDDCEKLIKRYSKHNALFGKLFQVVLSFA